MVTIGIYLFLLWCIVLCDRPGIFALVAWCLSMIVVYLVIRRVERKL